MKKFFLHYAKTCSFFCGALSTTALAPSYALPILFLTFGLFFFLLAKADSAKAAFARGYWFGFGYFACGLLWIGNALLLDWKALGWLYPLVPLAAGGFFGLFALFPAWLAFYFKGNTAKYLAFGGAFPFFEWIRSFFLTGFPWNLWGSVWCVSDCFIQAAALFGTYGLSWATWLIFAAPGLWLSETNRKHLLMSVFIPLIGIGMLWGFGCWRLQHASSAEQLLRIRLVQPSIPQSLKWNREHLEKNFEDYISLTLSQPTDEIDFVVWGETASPFALDADTEHLRQVLQAVPSRGKLITGMVRYRITPYENYLLYNSLAVIAPNGSIDALYDKSHLVPFGEYIPLKKYLPGWIRPVVDVIGDFQSGNGPEALKINGYPSFGALICYEIIFPGEIVDRKHRPLWLVNLTNDGWYGKSSGPYQHLDMARLRAVEEGLPLVRSANSGISAVIDSYGRVLGEIALHERGILDENLPLRSDLLTVYGKNGNVIPLILCLLNIILAFYFSVLKLKK